MCRYAFDVKGRKDKGPTYLCPTEKLRMCEREKSTKGRV